MKPYKLDQSRLTYRRGNRYLRIFFFLFRKAQRKSLFRALYKIMFYLHSRRHCIEISSSTKIGYGFCIWHPYNITIGSQAIIGNNVTISKGCLIGHEFRGIRKGSPRIGDYVWIGSNCCIVGKIKIGNDVLIAPNSYVNCDIPDHSIVIGNPCIIKHKEDAIKHYIQNPIADKDFLRFE